MIDLQHAIAHGLVTINVLVERAYNLEHELAEALGHYDTLEFVLKIEEAENEILRSKVRRLEAERTAEREMLAELLAEWVTTWDAESEPGSNTIADSRAYVDEFRHLLSNKQDGTPPEQEEYEPPYYSSIPD